MKNASPGREPNRSPSPAQNKKNTNQNQSLNVNVNTNTASNSRNASKSPNRKATGSKSNTKTSNKPMNKEFLLDIIGSDSVSDVNLPSWNGITEKDVKVGASGSSTQQQKAGKARTAGIYKLEDKHGKVQEPHVIKPGEGGRELGSNDSSTMSMDGEGAGTVQEDLDLDKIDHFRSHSDVDHELIKKIMKLDLNDTEMKNRMKNFYEAGTVTPPIHFVKAGSDKNKNKTGTGTGTGKSKAGTSKASVKKEKIDPVATRPGRHRVIVNERRRSASSGSGSQEKKSPYECDWIDVNAKTKSVKDNGNFAAYVTGPEYRLLKKFNSKTTSKTRSASVSDDEGYGLANYPGFTTKAPNVSKSPSRVITVATAAVTATRPAPPMPAKVKATGVTISTQTDEPKKPRKRTTETQTQPRRVGFNLDGNTVQLYEVDRENLTSETVLSAKNDNESKIRAVGIKMTGAALEDDETVPHENAAQLALTIKKLWNLNLDKAEDLHTFNDIHAQSVADLEVGILAVAEVSNIILHSLFKDPFPTMADKEEALDGDENFQEFLTARTDKEALGKMVQVFASTCGKIMNHLDLSDVVEVILKERGNLGISGGIANLSILDNLEFTKEERAELGQHGFELCLTNNPVRTSTSYSSTFEAGLEPKPNEYAMTLLGKQHKLLQNVYFKNTHFSLVYNANDSVVSSIASASREGFEQTPISSEKLYDIVSRNSSYLTGRMTSAKFYMTRLIDDFGLLVQEFLVGKYVKRTLPNGSRKTSPKFKTKLQSYNIFAGVIYQLSYGFTLALKKLQISLARAMKLEPPVGRSLDSIIGPFNYTGAGFVRDLHLNLPLETNIPATDAMEEFAAVIQQIDTILTTAKISLASLNRGVKVKPKQVKMIELMIVAVKQLEFGHDVDFGAAMIGLLSCTGFGDGDLSSETQNNMAVSLQRLYEHASELVRYSKKIGLLSSFVTSKTMFKIRAVNKEQEKKKIRIGTFFNRLLQRVRGQSKQRKHHKAIVPKLKQVEQVIDEAAEVAELLDSIHDVKPQATFVFTEPDLPPEMQVTSDAVVEEVTVAQLGEVLPVSN